MLKVVFCETKLTELLSSLEFLHETPGNLGENPWQIP